QRVRAHEAAHLAAGGGLAIGGATYGYVQGPDGQRYATSGEVQIDTSPGKTPVETIEKARQIQRAALAPSDPSGQDRAVAAQAGAMMAQARQDLARQKAEGCEGGEGESQRQGESRRSRGVAEARESQHPLRGVWRPVDLQA
ncbi:MAG: putative metalloprotease CJM1_0395 family protein, partial [Nitrospiraceae bacterium]